MIITEYKDEFKENFSWKDGISTGKIDNNKEKFITFYNSKRTISNTGFRNTESKIKTIIKPVTILLRYGKNQRIAEEMAQKIYNFYNRRFFFIGDTQIYAMLLYTEPIAFGTDENNVYEYQFEIDFIENSKEE